MIRQVRDRCPARGRNADGRLEIFARGGDGAVWHNWHTAPNNGWSGWYSLGGWIDLLEVGPNADGRLEVFARGGSLTGEWPGEVSPRQYHLR